MAGAGIGVYHFFADHAVNVTSGVVAPDALVRVAAHF
jgi:hypothetical protein|eukprot:COSAG06_NODE_4952_length_3835_cov_222.486884_4_plen_37_part_00